MEGPVPMDGAEGEGDHDNIHDLRNATPGHAHIDVIQPVHGDDIN